jgi:hypothetical protein
VSSARIQQETCISLRAFRKARKKSPRSLWRLPAVACELLLGQYCCDCYMYQFAATSDPATKVDKWIALKSHVVDSFVCIHLVRLSPGSTTKTYMLLNYKCGAHPGVQHAVEYLSKHFQAKNSNSNRKVQKEL